MKISSLDKKLRESLDTFSKQSHIYIGNMRKENLDEYDYDELAKQTFYVLNDFREQIIKYLKENKD